MYYTPAILELAGFRDKRSALLIAMLPAAGAAHSHGVEAWLRMRGCTVDVQLVVRS